MHKRAVLFILFLGLLTYGQSLFNGFTGDDEVLIVRNQFYRSWSNFPHLFDRSYITDTRDYYTDEEEYSSSGAVSYRPAATWLYFLDYAVWGLNPFGYHLNSVLWHLTNMVLVYWLVFLIFGQLPLAALSALLFGLHPIQAEAVCAVAYRQDLVAACFSLITVIAYIHGRRSCLNLAAGWQAVSVIFYFLALFAKESALPLPAVLLAYDVLLSGEEREGRLRNYLKRYLPFMAVATFYLYIYFCVFPNSMLAAMPRTGHGLEQNVVAFFRILAGYLAWIIFPAVVNIIPPLYSPSLIPLWGWRTWGSLITAGFFVMALVMTLKHNRKIFFGLVWFAIFYLPVANIIPLANPVAHRFMYLPSVGILFAAAYGLDWGTSRIARRIPLLPSIGGILRASIIGLCMIVTYSITGIWTHNANIAQSLLSRYPDNAKAHWILGIENFKMHLCPEAAEHLKRSVELGLADPKVYYMLGRCEPDAHRAGEYYRKAIAFHMKYAAPYAELGRLAYADGRYGEADQLLTVSVEMDPSLYNIYHLMEIKLAQNQRPSAEGLYRKAVDRWGDEKSGALKTLLNKRSP